MTPTTTTPDLASRLRSLLAERCLSANEVACEAGMARQQLHRILSGEVANPGILTVGRIVAAAGGTLGELFAEEEVL